MSCFVMDARATAALALTVEEVLNMGFNYFGFDAPPALFEALEDCKDPAGFYQAKPIFARLYALNIRAYAGRYHEEADTTPPDVDFTGLKISQPPEANTVKPWHYRWLKLVDCYIYQVEEDATARDPLALAMQDLSRVLSRFIATNSDEYAAAPWGSLWAPKASRPNAASAPTTTVDPIKTAYGGTK